MYFSKLSEYYKIFDMDQLLLLLKDPTFRLIRESLGCQNLNSVDRKSKMLWFSECLETDLLNGTGGLGLGSREWAECASKSLRLPRVG